MTNSVDRRRDPEHLLQLVEQEERQQKRGKLKIFLGYASGAGKSYRMLDEARRRHSRGQDVVVAATQPVRSAEIERLLAKLEVIPLVESPVGSRLDLALIRRRQPAFCVIDGLAFDNPPGSELTWRWQDAEALLDDGISVITSLNLQHIAEMAGFVEGLTGKRAASTVPKSFLVGAEEIVVVDVSPSVLLDRQKTAEASNGSAERLQVLSQLREAALLLAAEVIDLQLTRYLDEHGINQSWGTQERVMVCLTPRANAARMLEIGKRYAERFHGELIVAYVKQDRLSDADRQMLEEKLALARQVSDTVFVLEGDDPVRTLLGCAREHRATQIFVGHSERGGWLTKLLGSPLDRLLRAAEGFDVRVFPH